MVSKDKTEEKVQKKLREGWIKASMIIEALGVTKDAVKSALEMHIRKLKDEKKTVVCSTKFHGTREVEKPFPNVPKAYSMIVDIEIVSETYDQLVYIAMNYGPTSIEILEPEKIKMDMGEAQGILNSISDLVHRFAAQGIGGIVVRT